MGDAIVGKLEYLASINTAGLKKDAAEAEATVGKTGESIKNNVGKAMVATGVAMAGTGALFMKVAKDSLSATTAWSGGVAKLTRETGISTEAASKLLYAGKRYGLEVADMSKSLGIFSKKVVESAGNTESNRLATEKLRLEMADTQKQIDATTKEIKLHGDKNGELAAKISSLNNTLATQKEQINKTGDAFSKIGVNVKDAQGKVKPFDQLFGEVADKFKNAPPGMDKTATAMALFGKSGKDMLPLLNQGKEGMAKLGEQAQKFGLVLTKDNIAAFTKFRKASFESEQSAKGLQIQLGLLTLGPMTNLKKTTTELTQKLNELPGPMKNVIGNAIVFGGPILSAAGSLLTMAGSLALVTQRWPGLLSGMAASVVGAIRTAAVWTAQFAIMVTKAIATAAVMAAQAVVAGAAWVAQATVASVAWVVTELPKIVAGFIVTSASAVAQAAVSSAAWVASASKSAIAWVVTELPRIVTAFIATSAAAVTSAATATAAWVASATTSGAAFSAFAGLATAPIVVPALIITAALASIAILVSQVLHLKSLIDEKRQEANDVIDQIAAKEKNLAYISATPEQRAKHQANYDKIQSTRPRAKGGPVIAGNSYIVGEKRPELFIPDRSGTILPEIPEWGGGGEVTVNINMSGIMTRSKSDEREIARSLVRRLNDELSAKNQPLLGGGAI